MNVYAKPGTQVKFEHPTWGYPHHQKLAGEHLIVGNTYTVARTAVETWHTDVYLEEVPEVPFNSVLFEDMKEVTA